MNLGLHIHILCQACGKPWDEHEPECPRGKIIRLMDTEEIHAKCPLCRGALAVNTSDFFECRECHAQFCTGYGGGVDPDEAPQHFLLGGIGQDFGCLDGKKVVELPDKGTGEFRLDRAVEALEKQEQEWKNR